jgi:hypothetical protein
MVPYQFGAKIITDTILSRRGIAGIVMFKLIVAEPARAFDQSNEKTSDTGEYLWPIENFMI